MENNTTDLTMESFKERINEIDDSYKQTYYFLKNAYKQSISKVNRYNNMLTDVYHIIELCNISWWGRIKMYKILFEVLRKRREAKDMYTLAQCMFDRYKESNPCQPNINLTGSFVSKEKTLEVRVYKFKALTGIGAIRKGDEFKVDSCFEKSIWK